MLVTKIKERKARIGVIGLGYVGLPLLIEFGKSSKIHFHSIRFLASIVAVVPAMMMAFWNITDPYSGEARQAGWVLWPIFGASNQMLAALTLMVLTIYYWQKRKPILPLFIPMIIVMFIALSALVVNALTFFGNNNILFFLTLMLIALILWMMYEGCLLYTSPSQRD